LVRAFLLPKKEDLHNMHSVLLGSARWKMIRDEDPRLRELFAPRRIDMPVVLICGHRGRDERCGIMGPLLEGEFRAVLKRAGFSVPGLGKSAIAKSEEGKHDPEAVVGLISHVGGHKFAGNVIVYIPPQYKAGGGKKAGESPLAGMGIWYGRVEPRHVEGIVEETVLKGVIIEELFRGGIGADGKSLRID
jgi:Sucrase/ferredoxin-like